MALPTTYNLLVSELQTTLLDDTTEFTAALGYLIPLAEVRVYKALELAGLDSTETVTITQGTATIAKPTGWVATLDMWYIASGDRTLMYPRSISVVRDYNPDPADEGLPLYYAENSQTTWLVAPTPNFTGTGEARVVKYPSLLASGTQTTWLSENATESLWYSCLIAAEQFLKTDLDKPERIKMWENEFARAIALDKQNMASNMRSYYAAGQM